MPQDWEERLAPVELNFIDWMLNEMETARRLPDGYDPPRFAQVVRALQQEAEERGIVLPTSSAHPYWRHCLTAYWSFLAGYDSAGGAD